MPRCCGLFACLALTLTGCSTMSNTEKGVGIGGAIGAGLGTVIGAASGNPRTGAVAGGLLGAGLGGLAGSDADRAEKERADARREAIETASAQQAITPAPPSLNEIIRMSQQGVGDETIVTFIRQSHAVYRLTPDDVSMLKENRVSERVLQEMISSPSRAVTAAPAPRTVVVHEPSPVVVYERPYPYWYARPCPPPGIYIHGRIR